MKGGGLDARTETTREESELETVEIDEAWSQTYLKGNVGVARQPSLIVPRPQVNRDAG